MPPGIIAKENFKACTTGQKMCFEAEWITGCYQLIVPEFPAQECVKTQHDQYHVELQPSERVNTPQQSARPLVVREGRNKSVRMAVLPH